MAELLLMADTGDPLGQRPQRGDVFCVREDGFPWGDCETLDMFLVIRLPVEVLDSMLDGLLEGNDDRFRSRYIAWWEYIDVITLATIKASPWTVVTLPIESIRSHL